MLRRSVWAWPAGVALGLATLIWLVVQVLVVQRFHPLQAFIAAIGLSFFVLLALPSMRRYYRADATLTRLRGAGPDARR